MIIFAQTPFEISISPKEILHFFEEGTNLIDVEVIHDFLATRFPLCRKYPQTSVEENKEVDRIYDAIYALTIEQLDNIRNEIQCVIDEDWGRSQQHQADRGDIVLADLITFFIDGQRYVDQHLFLYDDDIRAFWEWLDYPLEEMPMYYLSDDRESFTKILEIYRELTRERKWMGQRPRDQILEDLETMLGFK